MDAELRKVRTLKTDIVIFLSLLMLTMAIIVSTIGQTTIDIQLHDTYFVFDKAHWTILIVGPITFLIFLARALSRKFRTVATNAGLILGLIMVGLITYWAIEVYQNYISEMIRLDSADTPRRNEIIQAAGKRMRWSWILLSVVALAVIVLTIRTRRIWKLNRHNQSNNLV
jgi:hypothetical protein